MRTIAFFTENIKGGGVEKILHTIMVNWDYQRYNVTLYSIRDEKELVLSEFPNNINYRFIFDSVVPSDNKIQKLSKKIKNRFKLFVYYKCSPRLFYRCFVRKEYDVGVAFIEGYATRILSGAPEGTKRIAWLHMELIRNHWTDVAFKNRAEENDCYKQFDHVVCVSKEVKRQIDDLYGIQDRTSVLYNPIDKDEIINQSLQKCESDCRHPGKCLLVTLGRLEAEKGYERLLNVVYKLHQERNDFVLWIIGDGSKRSALEEQIHSQKLDDVVSLLGYKSNPYPYLKCCDIYICSSFAEGYNTAITEALVLGKPIVSTECSGTREQLGNSEYGIVTNNNEEDLYRGIKAMLSPEKRDHYAVQSRLRRGIFNLNCQMNEIYRMIEKA